MTARYGATLAHGHAAPLQVIEAAADAFSRAEKSGLGTKGCAAVPLAGIFENYISNFPADARAPLW
jgi:hypothetical protein